MYEFMYVVSCMYATNTLTQPREGYEVEQILLSSMLCERVRWRESKQERERVREREIWRD